MPSRSSAGPWKGFFSSRWFLGSMFVLTILAALAYGRAYYQEYQIREEIERLQAEAERLSSKKIATLEALKYLKSSDFVEEKARRELNLVKPGEQVAVIANGSGRAVNGQENKNMIEQKGVSNPLKWWKYFFNKTQE